MYRLTFERADRLPPMAWHADVDTVRLTVRVRHGWRVETSERGFVEGAWDGPFDALNFDRASTLCGSGGRLREDALVFATPTDTLQPLYIRRTSTRVHVSNSLPFLLTATDGALDPHYPWYRQDLMSIKDGLSDYVRTLPVTAGPPVEVLYHANLRIGPGARSLREPKPVHRSFESYEDYVDRLQAVTLRVTGNAADAGRWARYAPLATVSTGYDSPAAAVLARAAGCREAITLGSARAGFRDRRDSGEDIARQLGLSCRVYWPTSYLERADLVEAEFIASAGEGGEVVFAAMEDAVPDSLLFTGFPGGPVWGLHPHLPEADLIRTDPSGCSIVEIRLRTGFIHFPVGFVGATRAASIAAIARSPAMAAWCVGPQGYVRPIPRRIVEEAGVDRTAFGWEKKAVATPALSTFDDEPDLAAYLSSHAHDHFAAYLAANPVTLRMRQRIWRAGMRGLARVNHRLLLSGRVLVVLDRLGVRGSRRWLVSRKYLKPASIHDRLVHWAVDEIRTRYRVP